MQIADDVDGAGPARAADRQDRSAAAPSAPESECGSETASQADVLGSLWKHASEFRAYAEELVRIEKDRARLSLREAVVRFRREALVFFALCTLVVIGSIYTLTGLSAALAALFRDQPWIGNLSIGLAAIGGAVVWMRIRESGKAREDLQKKPEEYDQRREKQSARFGRHVSETFAGADAPNAAQREGVPRSAGGARASGDGGVPGGPPV